MKRKIPIVYKLAILSLIINLLVLIYFIYRTYKLKKSSDKWCEKNAYNKTESFLVHSDSFGGYPRRYVRLPFMRFMSKVINDHNGYVIIGDFFLRFGRTNLKYTPIEEMFKDWYAGVSSIGGSGWDKENASIRSHEGNKIQTSSQKRSNHQSFWVIWGKVRLDKMEEDEDEKEKNKENEADPKQGWVDTSHEFKK